MDLMRTLRKLARTGRIAVRLAAARMFGDYEHSGFNGEFHYVRYRYRGKSWVIPTSAVEDLESDFPEHAAE